MWWKENKWKVIIPAVIVVLLVVTFLMGGPPETGGDGDRGTAGTAASAAPTPGLPEETAPAQTPAQPAPETAAPSEEPSPSEEPAVPPAEPSPAGEPSAPSEEPSPPEEPTAPSEEPSPSEETTVPSEEPSAPPEETAPAPSMEIDPETGKDQYLTDPVPEGKPLPVEPEDATVGDTAYTCTMSISCVTILDHTDWLDPEKVELVPEDGWVLEPVEVTFYEGESVFNVLQRVCRQNAIHMEFSMTPIYNSAYIEGIYNLYEFDCGNLSGWMYEVNDWFPNYGCSRYQLQDGDVIQWLFTCDLGDDVGGAYAAGKQV